jgi:hypothetical protein
MLPNPTTTSYRKAFPLIIYQTLSVTFLFIGFFTYAACEKNSEHKYIKNYIPFDDKNKSKAFYYTAWEYESEALPKTTLTPIARHDRLTINGTSHFFSHINSIIKIPEGYLIADRIGKKVIHCDYDFKVVKVIGKAGEGPGEFQSPRIVKKEGNLVYTVGTANRGFAVHSMSGGLVHSFKPQTGVYNPIISQFAVQDEKIVISSPNEDKPITILNTKGEKVKSFGKSMANYVKPDKFFRNRGHILNYTNDAFLFVGLDSPVIQEYDYDGELLAEHSFVDHPYFESFFNGVNLRKRKSNNSSSNTTYILSQDACFSGGKLYLLTYTYSKEADVSLHNILVLKKINGRFVIEKTLELTYPDLGVESPWFEAFCIDHENQKIIAFDNTSSAFLTFRLP